MAEQMAMMVIRRAGVTQRFWEKKFSANLDSSVSATTMTMHISTKLRFSFAWVSSSVMEITSEEKYALSIHSGHKNTRKNVRTFFHPDLGNLCNILSPEQRLFCRNSAF